MAIPKEKFFTEEDYYNDKSLPERCELINGVIVDMATSPNIMHQRLSFRLSLAIGNYILNNKGKCELFTAPTDVRLFDDTIVLPDIFVTCDPEKLDKQKMNGAPEWVIEIVSPSSVTHDYITKVNLYFTAGVKEYWIIDPRRSTVHVYIWDGEVNELNSYSFDEEIPVWIYRENDERLIIKISELGLL